MSHRKGQAKKAANATMSMAGNSKSTVSRSDLNSRGDTPQHKGISYSSHKNNTTVTTDSVNDCEERRVLQYQFAGEEGTEDDGASEPHIDQDQGEIDINQEISKLHQQLQNEQHHILPDLGVGMQKPQDITAPLLRQEDYFQSEQRSQLEQQTFVPQDFEGNSAIFQQNSFAHQDVIANSLRMPTSFLDQHLFYPDAFENQFHIETTLHTGRIRHHSRIQRDLQYSELKENEMNDNEKSRDIFMNYNLGQDQIPGDVGGFQPYQNQYDPFPFEGTDNSWREESMVFRLMNQEIRQQNNLLFDEPKLLEELKQDRMVPNRNSEDGCGQNLLFQDFDFTDPITPMQESSIDASLQDFLLTAKIPVTDLKRLKNVIHGDMQHCLICSSKFEEPYNLPRVLFCGDCLCEKCLRQSIQPKALNDGKNRKSQEAAGQLTCLVCSKVHIFKMTRNGFILCNDKYVKVRDEHGLVNFIGAAIKYSEEDLRRAIDQKQMMDNSINIPADLII